MGSVPLCALDEPEPSSELNFSTMNVDKKTSVDPQTRRQVLRFVGIHKPGQVAMIVDPDEAALAECYDRCSAR